MPLVEDAAQAPGGSFAGRPLGTHGAIGCFSFNQEKTLGIGEGGAVVTDDEALYRRLHAVRTDGYLPAEPGETGRFHRPSAEVQGGNYCMSEVLAALLPPQMAVFDDQNRRRIGNAVRLEEALGDVEGVQPLETSPGTTERPYYEFGLVLDRQRFGDWSLELVGRALAAELGAPVHPTDPPVTECRQFDPGHRWSGDIPERAASLYSRLLVLHHRLLLSPEIVGAVPAALRKVRAAAERTAAAEVVSGSAV